RVDEARTAVEPDVVLGVTDLRGAGRDNQILVADGRGNIAWGQAVGVHGVRIEVDHNLPLLAAPRVRHPRSLNRSQLLDDEVLTVIEDLLFGERVAADGDLYDRHAGGAVPDNVGGRDARRHEFQERLAGGGHLGLGLRDPGPRTKIDADYANPVERLALDVLDVVDRSCQNTLVEVDDPRFDLIRGHAGVLPNHAHDRDVDLRKDIRRHAVNAHGSQHSDQQGHDHERVGSTKREP